MRRIRKKNIYQVADVSPIIEDKNNSLFGFTVELKSGEILNYLEKIINGEKSSLYQELKAKHKYFVSLKSK